MCVGVCACTVPYCTVLHRTVHVQPSVRVVYGHLSAPSAQLSCRRATQKNTPYEIRRSVHIYSTEVLACSTRRDQNPGRWHPPQTPHKPTPSWLITLLLQYDDISSACYASSPSSSSSITTLPSFVSFLRATLRCPAQARYSRTFPRPLGSDQLVSVSTAPLLICCKSIHSGAAWAAADY
jgi:hypothetical protein